MSIIMAYSLWNLLQHTLILERTCTVPVCFYNTTSDLIAIPDTVQIVLKGPKAELNSVDVNTLALHVNGDNVHTNNHQWLSATEGTVFVPNAVAVIHYNPARIAIHPKTM
jgi:hypothetical protein